MKTIDFSKGYVTRNDKGVKIDLASFLNKIQLTEAFIEKYSKKSILLDVDRILEMLNLSKYYNLIEDSENEIALKFNLESFYLMSSGDDDYSSHIEFVYLEDKLAFINILNYGSDETTIIWSGIKKHVLDIILDFIKNKMTKDIEEISSDSNFDLDLLESRIVYFTDNDDLFITLDNTKNENTDVYLIPLDTVNYNIPINLIPIKITQIHKENWYTSPTHFSYTRLDTNENLTIYEKNFHHIIFHLRQIS